MDKNNRRQREKYASDPAYRARILAHQRLHRRAHKRTYRQWYWLNRDDKIVAARFSSLWRRYGLTLDAYHAMVEAQGERCPTCRDAPAVLTVDHCHKTGKVRGLLCHHCNRMLGLAKDRAPVLRAAIRYLKKHAA